MHAAEIGDKLAGMITRPEDRKALGVLLPAELERKIDAEHEKELACPSTGEWGPPLIEVTASDDRKDADRAMSLNTDQWVRVSKQTPCPICGPVHGVDWCGVSVDGTTAICMRIQSDRPARNGGWIHRLSDPIPTYQRPPPRDDALRPCFESLWRNWRICTEPVKVDAFARHLGVNDQALWDLGAAWAWQHSAWAFPMHDGAGKIDGIRLRNDAGDKWAVKGSHQGIFMPRVWPSVPDMALICEGPTDTAAALTLGFYAIGRPSCVGCEDIIVATIRRLAIRRVVVVADNDGPGKAGAERLSKTLRVPNKTIVPPGKDIREWVRNGATQELVNFFINQKLWRMP